MDTWMASISWLSWIILLWTRCTSVCLSPCFQFFWIYTQKWNCLTLCILQNRIPGLLAERPRGRAEAGASEAAGTGLFSSLTSDPSGWHTEAPWLSNDSGSFPSILNSPHSSSGRQGNEAHSPLWTDKDEAQGGRASQPAALKWGPLGADLRGGPWHCESPSSHPAPLKQGWAAKRSKPEKGLCQASNKPEIQPRASRP